MSANYYYAVLLLLFCKNSFCIFFNEDSCFCEDPSLCKRVTSKPLTEMYLFLSEKLPDAVKYMDWSRVSTIALGIQDNKISDVEQVICEAHKNNVRVIVETSSSSKTLTNETTRINWVKQQLKVMNKYFLDGLNVDFEDSIEKDSELYNNLTSLIKLTRMSLPTNAFLVMDYTYCPDCMNGRVYDIVEITPYIDFYLLMFYDMQHKHAPLCHGGASSNISIFSEVVKQWDNYGIARSKLLSGWPWYAYNWPCDRYNATSSECYFSCDQLYEYQTCYDSVVDITQDPSIKVNQDRLSLTKWFSYQTNSKQINQVWYDDPDTLSQKYTLSKNLRLRGVGVFRFGCLSYDSTVQKQASASMWNALPLV